MLAPLVVAGSAIRSTGARFVAADVAAVQSSSEGGEGADTLTP